MLIATFGATTAWVGKTITYADEHFVLEEHGPIVASAIVEYDKRGHLEWSSEGLRKWVYELAAELAPLAPPPVGSVLQRKRFRRSSAASEEAPEASDPAEASAGTATRTDIPVATFLAGTAFADKTIVSDDGTFVIEGVGAVTAAEVMEFDRGGQLTWANDGARAWVGSKAAGWRADPRVRVSLDKARKQYKERNYNAAVRMLWDLLYATPHGDQPLEAARGIWELANEIGARVDGQLGVDCAQLVEQSSAICRGERVLVGPKTPEAAGAMAEPSESAPAPAIAPPLGAPPAVPAPSPPTPSKPDPRIRKQLDKAQRQYEKGKQRAAVETLWLLDAQARQGDAEAARGIIELASEMGTHVEGNLVEECADLVARSRKALAPAPPKPASKRTETSFQQAAGNLGFLWVVALSPLLSVVLTFVGGTVASGAAFWAGLGVLALLLSDRSALKNAGANVESLLIAAIFLPPVYLFLRLRRTDQTLGPFWVWLGCFGLFVVVVAFTV